MYLSRLILNQRSHQVQREISDPYEMHRTILRAFSQGKIKVDRKNSGAVGVLYRLEQESNLDFPTLLVQSQIEPDWSFLLASRKDYLVSQSRRLESFNNPAVKQFELALSTGQLLAFRLYANPTVKKDRQDKDQGCRVGLTREEDQMQWLNRKVTSAGAKLITASISRENKVTAKLFTEPEDNRRMRFIAVQFEGVLQVVDPARLVAAIASGIGSAKSFGFGLLSLAPARG